MSIFLIDLFLKLLVVFCCLLVVLSFIVVGLSADVALLVFLYPFLWYRSIKFRFHFKISV